MAIASAQRVVERLKALQRQIRDAVLGSRGTDVKLSEISRSSEADTIYRLDAAVEPLLVDFVDRWAREEGPLVLVAEGLEDGHGREVPWRVFPNGAGQNDAALRVIVDPVDGTRGLMYDKRAAWSLAGAAPNKGATTRLRDIEVAVMSELPTSKMGRADVLWAIKGQGALGERVDLGDGKVLPLALAPSRAADLEHGFASISSFFPGTKVLAGELIERIAAEVGTDSMFEDQYISTGGQFYELIVGHDRFNADLRPAFYRMRGIAEGLCCHPYDCAAWLIAEEAGVVLTDDRDAPLDGPMDTTTGLCWVGYANEMLRARIAPVIRQFLKSAG
jgi:fructose-1,6-bisphosphatase/inositol monophosphatase family enzyme